MAAHLTITDVLPRETKRAARLMKIFSNELIYSDSEIEL